MKKIIKPAEREESVYYSDFTGKSFGEGGPDVVLKISFGYGSGRDGAELELHLNDKEVDPIIDLIKSKLSSDFKENFKKKLKTIEENYNDSMQMRDWGSCDYLTNSIWFMRELLDVAEKNDMISDHLSEIGFNND
jgi:hypothetical protein